RDVQIVLGYAHSFLRQVDSRLDRPSLQTALPLLRKGLGLSDFGELMFAMPDGEFPNLSRALPRMASIEVQTQWTGASGSYLLQQTCSFVRIAACNFSRLTKRSLDQAS